MRIPVNLDALSARLAVLPADVAEGDALAYTGETTRADVGWIAIRRLHHALEIHVFLDRSIAGLPSLHVRQHCADQAAVAQYLEEFDPFAASWRDGDGPASADDITKIGARGRKALLAARYADLVGRVLSQLTPGQC